MTFAPFTPRYAGPERRTTAGTSPTGTERRAAAQKAADDAQAKADADAKNQSDADAKAAADEAAAIEKEVDAAAKTRADNKVKDNPEANAAEDAETAVRAILVQRNADLKAINEAADAAVAKITSAS